MSGARQASNSETGFLDLVKNQNEHMDLGVACGEGESEAEGGNGGGRTDGNGVETLVLMFEDPVVLFIVCLLVVPSLRIKMWF